MKVFRNITTALVVASLFAVNFSAYAKLGTVLEISIPESTATTMDINTREIVRFEDVDPTLKMNPGCVVDYYNPTEQEARRGATPQINEVIECPR